MVYDPPSTLTDIQKVLMILFTPYIMARASLTNLEYLLSVFVRVHEAKAIGRSSPFDILGERTAPIPYGDASEAVAYLECLS